MNKLWRGIALSCCMVLLSSCDWFGGAKKESPAKMYIINVLDKVEFDDAHIKGSDVVKSINVAFDAVKEWAAGKDKTIPMVVYCSNYFCTASGEVAQQLQALGFTDVYAYEGGMAEWYQLSKKDPAYGVQGPAKQDYLEMVIKKPAGEKENIRVITAQELQKMMKAANMLDREVAS